VAETLEAYGVEVIKLLSMEAPVSSYVTIHYVYRVTILGSQLKHSSHFVGDIFILTGGMMPCLSRTKNSMQHPRYLPRCTRSNFNSK
jgi:hypothetical protein